MTNRQSHDSGGEPINERSSGSRRSLSWRGMLALLALAILVAAAIAYLLVNPFFHQQPR